MEEGQELVNVLRAERKTTHNLLQHEHSHEYESHACVHTRMRHTPRATAPPPRSPALRTHIYAWWRRDRYTRPCDLSPEGSTTNTPTLSAPAAEAAAAWAAAV